MNEHEARELIELIAAERRREDSPNLRNALRLLADELNSKDSHFILELIQNAEDNRYRVPNPELHIAIVADNPCGTPDVESTLITHNNEQGFLPENVRSLAAVGDSTKKKSEASGYIGEKGIGFKSVFRVTDEPHIFSGPFRFKFKKPTLEEPTGYIHPHWISTLPNGLRPGFTSIFLPLLPGKAEAVAAQLELVAPETLLFLKRIRTLHLGPNRKISIEGTMPRFRLTGPNGTGDYFVHSDTYPVPESARDERRSGVTLREIFIAFPVENQPQTSATIFAFLPTEIRSGLPFLINADFVVSSNRESILEDRPWNRWMRDQIGVAIAQAFLALLEIPDLRASAWRQLPDFDKPNQRHPFFEPSVIAALRLLAHSPCIPTDQGTLAPPNAVHAPSASMREVLANSTDRLVGTHLLHPTWARAPRSILRRLGVMDLPFSRLLEILDEPAWLEQRDIAWWIRFLTTCKDHDQTRASLGEFAVLRCQDGHCRNAQETVYVRQSGDSASVKLQPNWPPTFTLDPNLLAGINARPELAGWFKRTFALPGFNIGQYIAHSLIPWISMQISEGNLQSAISATVFIAQEYSRDRSLSRIIQSLVPWICSKTSAARTEQSQMVTPEGFEHGLPWYRVLQSSADRAHLIILDQSYLTHATLAEQRELLQLMQMCEITDCPKPKFSSDGAYYPPEWLEQLTESSEDQKQLTKFTTLEDWLARLYQTDSDIFTATPWGASNRLLDTLHSRPWLPSTHGRSAPSRAFFDIPDLQGFLGAEVPYSRSSLPEGLLALLGVQRSLPSGTLIQILQDFRTNPIPPQRLILNIYKRLDSQNFESHRFHEESLIWLACPTPKWMRVSEVTWKDYGADMDGYTWSVERTYGDHELHGFFVNKIGVTEKPPSQQLLTIWATLCQQDPESKSETQKRMTHLLRDLDDLDFIKEPWWPERRATLGVWTESGDFAQPTDVYVPDSGHAEELFRDMVPIAWVPKSGSKAIIRLLLEIGCESLARSLRSYLHRRPDAIDFAVSPQLLTSATKELILLATLEKPVGPREEPLLTALLKTGECNHADLQIRYELAASPWWKDSHSSAHWDAQSACLLLDPRSDLEERRSDTAKSIARALYPGDTAQHDLINALLSKTVKHATKIARDKKWAGSTSHLARLSELGLGSFLGEPDTAETESASESRPQRHEFLDSPVQGQAKPTDENSSNQAGGSSLTSAAISGASTHGPTEPQPVINAGGGSCERGNQGKPSTDRSHLDKARTSGTESEPNEEPKEVKYPHMEKAAMSQSTSDGRRQDSSRKTQNQSKDQDIENNIDSQQRPRRHKSQNQEIEQAAMEHVRKWLTENIPGCEIFDVSRKLAYGHDYLVKWRARGLRIEVKGHSGDGNSIILTPNELVESRRTNSQYPWELWNVTNLASRKQVTITRYSNVPDGAIIKETGVRVDLSRCVPAQKHQK